MVNQIFNERWVWNLHEAGRRDAAKPEAGGVVSRGGSGLEVLSSFDDWNVVVGRALPKAVEVILRGESTPWAGVRKLRVGFRYAATGPMAGATNGPDPVCSFELTRLLQGFYVPADM